MSNSMESCGCYVAQDDRGAIVYCKDHLCAFDYIRQLAALKSELEKVFETLEANTGAIVNGKFITHLRAALSSNVEKGKDQAKS